jgi:hypothetical protein
LSGNILSEDVCRGRVEDFIIGCVTGPFSSISCLLGRISGVSGKVDPNYDIFSEKDEPRPRSSSTSVGSKSKSWNPFGSLFSKKRSKSSQSGENLSKTGTGSQVKGNGPVISQPRNKTPEILPFVLGFGQVG